MKAVVCALVLMLVCSVTVNALQCYTCDSGNCKVPADCPASANFCMTVANATYLSRTCEETCVSDVNVYCCSTDLCG